MIMTDVNDGTVEEMNQLVKGGITSFKLFVAYPGVLKVDGGQIFPQCSGPRDLRPHLHARGERPPDRQAASRRRSAEGTPAEVSRDHEAADQWWREGTHRRDLVSPRWRTPLRLLVHLSAERALKQVVMCARPRSSYNVRRDLPAPSVPFRGRPWRAPSSKGRSTSARPRSRPVSTRRGPVSRFPGLTICLVSSRPTTALFCVSRARSGAREDSFA